MRTTRNTIGRSRAARGVGTLVLLACVLIASGCGGDGPTSQPDPGGDQPATTAAGGPGGPGGPGGGPEVAGGLYFYPPVQGATLSVTATGVQGGGSEVTVETVASGADGQTVTVSEVVSSADSTVEVERSFRTGPDGSLSIDPAGFLASAAGLTVSATGDEIRIPPVADLEAGDTATGETFVEFGGAGVSIRNDISYVVTGEGYQPITVPAGSYDRAYLVSLELTVDSSAGAGVTGTLRYWFVPGFARVRQESTIDTATFVEELAASSVTP